jgi:hypothetical protein
VKLYSTTTAARLADLHPALDSETAAVVLANYRQLEEVCRAHDIDVYHIQASARPRPVGHGRWLFFELGGEEACAWVSKPPPEFLWGPFRPQAHARIYHPGPTRLPKRGAWIYLTDLEETWEAS